MKVLSLFSGLGAFEKALTRQNIKYELINYCEIDKYASRAYSLIHNEPEEKNLGDITKINKKGLAYFDLMTWGFPCTDISIAGKQEGFIDQNGNKTRSGLYYEGLEILKEKKPKYSIIENVKNLTSKKFKKQFDLILKDLENEGYNNYWQVLNAKDYGIPQNRERVIIVSIRKDIDDGKFEFSKSFDNGLRLKDLLEDEVDEKFYLSEKVTERLINICNQEKMHKPTFIDADTEFSPTVTTRIANGGNWETYIIKGCSARTRNYLDKPQQLEIRKDGLSNSITTVQKDSMIFDGCRIRKYTPLECFRLMGFDDQDYYICKENKISDSQLYKMAGNSIVVNVLEYIFIKLIK